MLQRESELTQFTKGDIERQLHCLAYAIHCASHDQSVDVLRHGANNDSDQRYEIATNEKPPSSEEVTEPTKDGVRERQCESSCNVDP